VLADLGVQVANALGDILIMVGTAMGPTGIPLILAGLGSKFIGGLASGVSQDMATPQTQQTGGSRLYGNDIRIANDYASQFRNRVG